MVAVKLARVVALVLATLFGGACATGGPAGVAPRTRCADDRGGDPNLRPLVFLFCVQSP
jgi:hypothetical protein